MMKIVNSTRGFLFFFLMASFSALCQEVYQPRMSLVQANQWYEKYGWPRGCNFQPSTAINQLEMWQKDTFDPLTIDRELGWASDLGMNCQKKNKKIPRYCKQAWHLYNFCLF
jgi:hypothetical protein